MWGLYVQFDLIVHNTKKISLDFTDPHFFTNAAEAEATNAAEAETTNTAEAETTNAAEAETINAAEAKTEATNVAEAAVEDGEPVFI